MSSESSLFGTSESVDPESGVHKSERILKIGVAPGVFPTYFVFIDLPHHIEYRSQDLPLLNEGTVVDFDIQILSLKDRRRVTPVQGPHILTRGVLKYGGKRHGITQYLEWKSI